MTLTPTQAKLAAKLLRMAANEFGNHSCNDFNLGKIMPDVEERRALMKLYHERNGDPEEFDPTHDYKCAEDFRLMGLIAHMLEMP